jgi:hypothetical protein
MEIDGPQFSATVPIAFRADGTLELRIIGSGVVARLFGRAFLLTAAHVAHQSKEGALFIPGASVFVPLPGSFFASEEPHEAQKTDALDVCFFDLGPASDLAIAPRIHPLSEIDSRADEFVGGSANIYTFFGYPASRVGYRGNDIITGGERIAGSGLNAAELERFGLHPARHLAIRFHRRKSRRIGSDLRYTAPMPHGMSGGAIYAWPKAPIGQRGIPTTFYLVGIAHTYLQKECLLIGTRVEGLLSAIKSSLTAPR